MTESDKGNVPVRTFKQYWLHPIPRHSILKIDAEAHSAAALIGFGEAINAFSVVVIEMQFDNCALAAFRGQSSKILSFMSANGFTKMSCMDVGTYSGQAVSLDMAFWK